MEPQLVQIKDLKEGDITEHFEVLKILDWQGKLYLTVKTLSDGQVGTNGHTPDTEVLLVRRGNGKST